MASLLAAMMLPLTRAGLNSVNITRAMTTRATFQQPELEGLRDMVVTRDERAIINSDQKFTFWFEEKVKCCTSTMGPCYALHKRAFLFTST